MTNVRSTWQSDLDYTSKVRICVYAFLIVILILNIIYKIATDASNQSINHNRLALGSKALVTKKLISLNTPLKLPPNKEEILKIRENTIFENADLIIPPYKPSWAVFGRINDSIPFLSTKSVLQTNVNDINLEESSFESYSIVNPYLLLEPVWKGLNNPNQIRPEISKLEYYPADKKISVTVELKSFFKGINLPVDDNFEQIIPYPINFSINGYNARDLGLNKLIYISSASSNINSGNNQDIEVQLTEYIGLNKVICNDDLGCNHRINGSKILESFKISALPATAVFILSRLNDSSEDNIIQYIIQIK
jgi:hypothetical protein